MSQTEPEQEWPSSPGGVADPQPAQDENRDEPRDDRGGAERYAPEPESEPASPYGAHGGYGAQAPSYGAAPPAPYPAAAPGAGPSAPASTIVLLVVSGLLTLTGVGLLWVAPAVLATVSLVKHPADPSGARRLARIGWWIAAGLAALGLLAIVAVVVLLLVGTSLFTFPASGYDPSTVGLTTALRALLPAAGR